MRRRHKNIAGGKIMVLFAVIRVNQARVHFTKRIHLFITSGPTLFLVYW
jgi:hypothetical protein